ncbi:MAG: hypothetical protein ABI333_09360 [bacterium]
MDSTADNSAQSRADDRQPDGRWVRFTLVLVLVSLALSLPALLSGYWWDDYYFASRLIEHDAPFGYYEFGSRSFDSGLAPWWASPDHRVSFFRPLSSATLHLDFSVWNGNPLLAHLHAAAWFVLLLLGATRLFRLLLPVKVAKWAAVIFAISACHAWTVGWIAARHTVVGGAFSVWSLLYYVQWRQLGKLQDAGVALALLVLGLLSSETALAVAAVVLAHELAGGTPGTLYGWRGRALAAAPTMGVALVYVILYKASGHGVYGSALYADPTLQPAEFLAGVLPKIVSIFGTFVFGVHTSLAMMPGMGWIPVAAGGVGLALVAAGLALCWPRLEATERRRVRWLSLATLLGIAPALASFPQGRSVAVSCLTFAAVAGIAVTGLFAARHQQSRRLRRLLALCLAVPLCVGLLLTSPLQRLGLGALLHSHSKTLVKLGRESKVRCQPTARVVLLNGDLMFSIHAQLIVAAHQRKTFPGWHQLTEPATDIVVERTGRNSIFISSRDTPLVNAFTLNVFRPRTDKLTPGKVVEKKQLRIEILKSSPGGPTRVKFTIPGLNDPSRTCLLYYDGKAGVLRNATLPPRGQTLTIKWHGPKM